MLHVQCKYTNKQIVLVATCPFQKLKEGHSNIEAGSSYVHSCLFFLMIIFGQNLHSNSSCSKWRKSSLVQKIGHEY